MFQTVCGVAIDWSATGDMLQGLGTLLGAGAVLVAAKLGASTFKAWRRQKITERHIDQAERILTSVYRARRALEYVRGPMLWAHELTAAEETLRENAAWGNQPEERQKRLVTAQGYYNRIERVKEEREDLERCQPMAHALFGEALEKELRAVNHQFWLVKCDVDAYIDDDGSDREFSKQIRQGMSSSRSVEHEGVIDKNVRASVEKIEAICLPVLRME